MRRLLAFMTVLAFGFAIFSLISYAKILKEKNSLLDKLNEMNLELEEVSKEKESLQEELVREKEMREKLQQEKADLKESLKRTEERLTKINQELNLAQENIKLLRKRYSFLKKENLFLRREFESLKSIEDLKRFARELKMRQRRLETKGKIKEDISLEGNSGFIVKEGRSTYLPKYKIEVIPTP